MLINIIGGIIAFIIGCILWNTFDKRIFPWLVDKTTKDIEINPKWITSKVEYYGFSDIDFIIVNSLEGTLPRFRMSKDKKRFQLLLSEDTTTNDVDAILQLALAGKIRIKHGIWFPDKPIYWLSILCHMLDGGDVQQLKNK